MFTFIAEDTKTTSLAPIGGTTAAVEGYVAPTAGTMTVNVRAIVSMGEATDLVLSLQTADDAVGANPVAFPVTVPLYVDGAKQTAAVTYTVTAATGEFVVDFCVDPGLIPEGKFVGVEAGISNALNLVALVAIEDTANKPSA